jgi:hypothetical protein
VFGVFTTNGSQVVQLPTMKKKKFDSSLAISTCQSNNLFNFGKLISKDGIFLNIHYYPSKYFSIGNLFIF